MLKKLWLVPLLLVILYLVSHVFNLTALPVFADEAIYIRWAQLILDDAGRYLFFPINDGKTPLFIWLLAPIQLVASDQLWAGRILSVVVGVLQVIATGYLVHLLGGKPKTVWLSMILVTILPFWFFHHRIALMDGFLTLWLTVLLIGLVKLSEAIRTNKKLITRPNVVWATVSGVALGAGLLTKLPALLFLPTFAAFSFWLPLKNSKRVWLWIAMAGAVALGGVIFLSLKLNPAFGQLFSRGNDFLYPWSEVLLDGKWRETIISWPNYVSYFLHYLTVPVMLLVVAGLFTKPHQRINHVLFWSALGFLFPIALLGKVVYPRYLLPAAINFTVIAVLAFQDVVDRWVIHQTDLGRKMIAALVMVSLLAGIVSASSQFMLTSYVNPERIPFVSADRMQYLTEWSSGHGIWETARLIQHASKDSSVAVATEGFFGTLPDGLLLYFHRQNVDNIYIEGIGQPVVEIPRSFSQRAREFDRIWLVVNSHRLQLELPAEALIQEYCRPDSAPCLQIWDITTYLKQP